MLIPLLSLFHLRDPQPSPLILPQQLQRAPPVEVVFWDGFQHLFWELHMAVLELVVVVAIQIKLTSAKRRLWETAIGGGAV